MVANQPLTNLQQELLKLFAQQVAEADLVNIRALIGQYFAQRLTNSADEAWTKNGWTAQTMHEWLNDPAQ